MVPGPAPTSIDITTSRSRELGGQGRALLARALPAELVDDRFDQFDHGPGQAPASDAGFIAATATSDGRLVAYLGGGESRGRLQLDGLIEPGLPGADALGDALLAALAPVTAHTAAATLELWGRPAETWHADLASRHGFGPGRALHQMRCPLPIMAPPLPTRPMTEGDLDELLAVNNRAFAHHPDQSDLSVVDLRRIMAEPWFDPAGLRLHERDGRIVGFCWTKVHPHPDAARRLGEIFVIGIDPDYHGRGLGAPMTAAGLHWLHGRGLNTAMLYVEADNEPAVATYHRLGFATVRTDRAWVRPMAARP